jgi:creatinine amidohydrolase
MPRPIVGAAAGRKGEVMATPNAADTETEHRYNRLTWPEMNEAIARQPVVILPTGSTEQHGRHLPLDVDLLLCEAVCHEVGKRADGAALVLPAIPYGLNLHHIDFPGTIHIEPEVFIAFCLNVTKSVAYHGFEKILIINGHGSNQPLIDLIARRTTLQTDSLCAACAYSDFAVDRFREFMESPVMAHADEFETSLYLHIAPERVQMEQAGADDDVMGAYLSSDSTSPYVRFNDYWSRWTDLGVHGDARPATAEKGEIIFETAVTRLLELVAEWRAWPLEARRDFHERPVQSQIRW